MTIDKIKKCITVTVNQDMIIRAKQIQRMSVSKKNVSYSSILHEAIEEGLKHIG